jgi:hypothetical protein
MEKTRRWILGGLSVVSLVFTLTVISCSSGGSSGAGGGGTGSADTTPPSNVTNLQATVISDTQINLTWNAATDNSGIVTYEVRRCAGTNCNTFTRVGSPAGTSFSNTGLTALTAYSFRVKALDASNNESSVAAELSNIQTQAPPSGTGTVSGSIISAATGAPVPNTTVSIGALTTTTAANGSFTLLNVPASNRSVVHVDPPPAQFAETFPIIKVEAGQTTDLSNLAVVPTGNSQQITVAGGGTVNAGGARVVLPPAGLVRKDGGPAALTVTVSLHRTESGGKSATAARRLYRYLSWRVSDRRVDE